MKRLIVIGLFVNAVLLAGILGILQEKELAVAVGRGGTPKGNGDVNGDGSIDISDAVYTLTWLFHGGESPVAIDCPPTTGKGLPATGQTKCYDDAGNEIDCASADYPGQDGFYQAGCPTGGRFVDNGDGTVTDTCTGLMWQKDKADVNGSGSIEDVGDWLIWQDALRYCEDLSFAGYADWRLPNVRELESFLDYGTFFSCMGDGYWSSTSSAIFPDHGWCFVACDGGPVNSFYQRPKDHPYSVRAVRNAP